MHLLLTNAPAEIRRLASREDAGTLVASGPLIIMAHGLLALDPADRADFRIRTERGDLTPGDAEAVIQRWQQRH